MLNTTRLQVPACIAPARSPCSVNHYSTVKHEALAPEMSRLDCVALSAHAHTLRGWGERTPAATAPAEALWSLPRALPFGTAAEVLWLRPPRAAATWRSSTLKTSLPQRRTKTTCRRVSDSAGGERRFAPPRASREARLAGRAWPGGPGGPGGPGRLGLERPCRASPGSSLACSVRAVAAGRDVCAGGISRRRRPRPASGRRPLSARGNPHVNAARLWGCSRCRSVRGPTAPALPSNARQCERWTLSSDRPSRGTC